MGRLYTCVDFETHASAMTLFTLVAFSLYILTVLGVKEGTELALQLQTPRHLNIWLVPDEMTTLPEHPQWCLRCQ